MLWIVVTSPVFLSDEATFLHRLLANGVDIIHLRKPGASAADCARLLEELSAEDRSHIVVHDFFELAEPYGLRGIHLNARRNIVPEGYSGHVSRSCHSLEEVKQHKDNCNYVFLSPIFDSESKQGYASAFTDATLCQASEQGILDNKVVALGGVTPDKIHYLKSLNFGGAAMLGCINSMAGLSEAQLCARLHSIRECFIQH